MALPTKNKSIYLGTFCADGLICGDGDRDEDDDEQCEEADDEGHRLLAKVFHPETRRRHHERRVFVCNGPISRCLLKFV